MKLAKPHGDETKECSEKCGWDEPFEGGYLHFSVSDIDGKEGERVSIAHDLKRFGDKLLCKKENVDIHCYTKFFLKKERIPLKWADCENCKYYLELRKLVRVLEGNKGKGEN